MIFEDGDFVSFFLNDILSLRTEKVLPQRYPLWHLGRGQLMPSFLSPKALTRFTSFLEKTLGNLIHFDPMFALAHRFTPHVRRILQTSWQLVSQNCMKKKYLQKRTLILGIVQDHDF